MVGREFRKLCIQTQVDNDTILNNNNHFNTFFYFQFVRIFNDTTMTGKLICEDILICEIIA